MYRRPSLLFPEVVQKHDRSLIFLLRFRVNVQSMKILKNSQYQPKNPFLQIYENFYKILTRRRMKSGKIQSLMYSRFSCFFLESSQFHESDLIFLAMFRVNVQSMKFLRNSQYQPKNPFLLSSGLSYNKLTRRMRKSRKIQSLMYRRPFPGFPEIDPTP